MSSRLRPQTFHAAVVGGLTLGLTLGLFLASLAVRGSMRWEALLVCWLVAVNAVAFAYYGFDKSRARSSGRRVPEVVLHGLAVAGGTLGAYAGMQTFRHKTIKGPFRFVFWFIAGLQAALLLAVAYRLYFLN